MGREDSRRGQVECWDLGDHDCNLALKQTLVWCGGAINQILIDKFIHLVISDETSEHLKKPKSILTQPPPNKYVRYDD